MEFDKSALINYRLQRCDETIKDAQIAVDNNRLHNAENRIYYAIFYVVSTLAIKYNTHFSLIQITNLSYCNSIHFKMKIIS